MSTEINLWNNTLRASLALPFVKVHREHFLTKELQIYCSPEQLQIAVNESPTKVLTPSQISKIAKGCIKYHLTMVCAISAVAGLPGGLALVGAIPADIAQFYGHILALTQKLLYLYGWPSLENKDGKLDDETAQILTLFVGLMMGCKAANNAINKIAQDVAIQVAKRLPSKALTRSAIYNISKAVAKWIGISLTKGTFAKGISKIIPLIGAPVSATVTYLSFKPMAEKLKKHLDAQLQLQNQ